MQPIRDQSWDPSRFRESIQLNVDQLLAQERSILIEISPDLDSMMNALTALMRGGKRLRPAFCYWGWRAVAKPEDLASLDEQMLRAASSLEFLQACALIHDDVMDGSDTRRGLPAAHRSFQSEHKNEQRTGSSEMFGTGAAILLGDLCLAWADQLLFDSGLPAATILRAKPIFDVMRTELMAGQYLDLIEQGRAEASLQRARTVVRFKSAKYTIERPLHLGAALADATPETFASYTEFGLALGEAFQLRDDVLGVFGDPVETGKPAGDDLREGKRTMMIALAFERANAQQSAILHEHLGNHLLGIAEIEQLRQILEVTGALDATEALISAGTNAALAAIAQSAISDEGRRALITLVDAATRRAN
ncbi:MAG: polyprenyl synthetase family protein [Actinomycetota bacterium]|nr:polyprenyl synthetase family protein [Actinomycetota bacterium]